MIAMMRIIAIVDVTVEMRRSVEPWSGTHKYAAYEPIRTVVAIRGAAIWRVVEISVRTYWRRPDIYAYRNL